MEMYHDNLTQFHSLYNGPIPFILRIMLGGNDDSLVESPRVVGGRACVSQPLPHITLTDQYLVLMP